MEAYNQLIKLGRKIKSDKSIKDRSPEYIVNEIDSIEKKLQWSSIDDFFKLFPPVKKNADDGTWNYKSALEFIRINFGERFGRDDFKKIITNGLYENPYLFKVGVAYLISLSRVDDEEMLERIIDVKFID
ncbi:hypothetical protein AF332_12045 [Sporosarcina globispora]|uniref:Uncharacterized protein n=1 Tax=Sporosarcina globispora TaxID=1459 RepID=A0A0M0GD99_SPOGL|nr:hypothetical protein [Sporosarcina globispora]KON87487.1 hypothetical protein AF332_12045 [Sporosarcina globispora]